MYEPDRIHNSVETDTKCYTELRPDFMLQSGTVITEIEILKL